VGHGENKRNRENQPEEGALDTNQDKGVEETNQPEEETKPTAKAAEEEKEETLEAETEESMVEEEKPVEEVKEEGVVEGAEEEKEEATIEEAPEEEAKEEVEELAPEEKEEEEKKREAPEEEIVEERIYTIPLGRAWISPRKKRTPRAVRIVKSFVQKHMKIEAKAATVEEEEEAGRLVISEEVNRRLWSKGIEKPPRNIRVRAVKDKEGTVTLYLAEGD